MKIKWVKPEVANLNIKYTLKSVTSCGKTYAEALANVGKGCSFTSCTNYSKNNSGDGKGGKCGGPRYGAGSGDSYLG